ncbi:GntR family transcriptional regulator [Leucobacter komagatae]|uniref:GntR family transcriptional regulator n=1 Tax=Leucobacter komagatae TaxID=55969 RepID=A0A0D0IT73_9MICO|nr:GntR family transcriptional regulator [Leucobacter komagatae]KIP52683.1 GntR family transcriptional regulator [Leucobacter komagatae]
MFEDSRPIFQQIAEGIVDDILRGRYAEGEQVPSTNELAAYLRINPATAGKGLGLLVDQGILVKRRGIGMFVADGATERVSAERRERFAADFIQPLIAEAKAIGLDQEALIRLIAESTPGGAPDGGPPHTD